MYISLMTSRKFARHVIPILMMLTYHQLDVVSGFKILLITLPASSHLFSLTIIGQELVNRGHEVHLLVDEDFELSADLMSNSSKIVIHRYGSESGVKLDFKALTANVTHTFMMSKEADMKQHLPRVMGTTELQCKRMLSKNEALFEELKRVKFHMSLVDSLFFIKCFYLLPHRLGIPWVTYTDFIEPLVVRVPWLTSFVPLKITNLSDRMSFSERLKQHPDGTFPLRFPTNFRNPRRKLSPSIVSTGDFASMDDLISRSLLFISTDDVTLDYPRPRHAEHDLRRRSDREAGKFG